jgi:hypothetical protein
MFRPYQVTIRYTPLYKSCSVLVFVVRCRKTWLKLVQIIVEFFLNRLLFFVQLVLHVAGIPWFLGLCADSCYGVGRLCGV